MTNNSYPQSSAPNTPGAASNSGGRRWFLVGLSAVALCCLVSGCGTVGGMLKEHATVTPAVTSKTGAVITPAKTNISYSVSPAVQAVVQTGEKLAPVLPPPAGALATTGLGLLSGVLGLVAAWKNKKLNQAQKVAAIVKPIVAGVEAAASPAVKKAIQSHAVAAGVQAVLDPVVQSVSSQMPSSAKPA